MTLMPVIQFILLLCHTCCVTHVILNIIPHNGLNITCANIIKYEQSLKIKKYLHVHCFQGAKSRDIKCATVKCVYFSKYQKSMQTFSVILITIY